MSDPFDGQDLQPRLTLSVVVPVYNSETTLSALVSPVSAALAGTPFEILLVNDGSRDATGAILDEMAAEHPRLRVVHQATNQGKAVGPWKPELEPERLRRGLRAMMLTRAYDDRMFKVQRQGKTSCYMQHLGEEAVSTAFRRALAREMRHLRRDRWDLAGITLLPGILKTARMGYDGKGQIRVKTRAELVAAWDELQRVGCVLEKMLPLAYEVSVIVARGRDGQVVHFPLQQNLHRDGILAVTTVPAPNVTEAVSQQAYASAHKIAASMDYVGVLCIEFFVLQDGRIVANEMAPRPHNSGHHTIDACDVSQFELQVRAMTGLPLVAPVLHSPCLMLNLLGDLWFPEVDGQRATVQQEPDWAAVLALSGTHLHLYGKSEARVGRKMGHLTVTGATPEAARATALQAAAILGIAPF